MVQFTGECRVQTYSDQSLLMLFLHAINLSNGHSTDQGKFSYLNLSIRVSIHLRNYVACAQRSNLPTMLSLIDTFKPLCPTEHTTASISPVTMTCSVDTMSPIAFSETSSAATPDLSL